MMHWRYVYNLLEELSGDHSQTSEDFRYLKEFTELEGFTMFEPSVYEKLHDNL